MSTIVVCENLSKRYEQGSVIVHALKGVDLEFSAAAFDTLCGPSGSGKTTLLNLIGGLDEPSEGTVRVEGTPLHELSSSELAVFRLTKIGFVFQAYNLLPVLTARENVEFVLQLQGMPVAERRERSDEILEAVGLAGLGSRRPAELSGGQQQRVAVARAIVSQPALVLADEPTANLDSTTARSLLELMQSLNESRGITFIFSTHDPLVMSFAKRKILLKDGGIERIE